MINLKAYVDSLKLCWIRRLYQTTAKWQVILKSFINIDVLANCGEDYVQICQKKMKNKFWIDVFKAWNRLIFMNEKYTFREDSILKSPIWFNRNITIGRKSVFTKSLFEKNVLTVNDLIKDHSLGDFYTFHEFLQTYNITPGTTNFLHYHSILSAVKQFLSSVEIPKSKLQYPLVPLNIEVFLRKRKGSRDFYNILIQNNIIPTGKVKWNKEFELNDATWAQIYKTPFVVTKNTKLQWIQYRINHHILTTNSFLFKARLAITPRCILCNAETETIIHALWECQEVQTLLVGFTILLDALLIPFAFNKQSFIFGLLSPNSISYKADNEILLLIKQYIYSMRCLHKSLNINSLISTIKDYYNLQKYIAYSQGERVREKFEKEWKKWEKISNL
ncbi:uncharacterized protein LOC117342175 [Pecten maximus]|uniref:uncharacterized protein LOC117342175 n=1 Tax=Pecten maximus TaxID=6579 RepID=UPI001458513E|nr:uncharacterized protein LOC117342175 [Pecten maximus]